MISDKRDRPWTRLYQIPEGVTLGFPNHRRTDSRRGTKKVCMPIALRVSIVRLMTIARDQVSRADPPTVTVIQQAVPTLVTGRDLLGPPSIDDPIQSWQRLGGLDQGRRRELTRVLRQGGSLPTSMPSPPGSLSLSPTDKPKATLLNSKNQTADVWPRKPRSAPRSPMRRLKPSPAPRLRKSPFCTPLYRPGELPENLGHLADATRLMDCRAAE